MKRIIGSFALLLFLFVPAFAADAAALFNEFPSMLLKDVDRAAAVSEHDVAHDLLKLKFPKEFEGEFKIIASKNSETIVGFSVYSCTDSDFEIWRVKNGAWTEITQSAAPKLGKSDVFAMLKVSPATVGKLGENVTIPYFFTFAVPGNDLRLIVRRQSGCEVAGTVHDYGFNGKKYSRR